MTLKVVLPLTAVVMLGSFSPALAQTTAPLATYLTEKQSLSGTGLTLMLPKNYSVKQLVTNADVKVFNLRGPEVDGEFSVTVFSSVPPERSSNSGNQWADPELNGLINFTMGFLEGSLRQQVERGGGGSIEEVHFFKKAGVYHSQSTVSATGMNSGIYTATIHKKGGRAVVIAYFDKTSESVNDREIAQQIMETLQGL